MCWYFFFQCLSSLIPFFLKRMLISVDFFVEFVRFFLVFLRLLLVFGKKFLGKRDLEIGRVKKVFVCLSSRTKKWKRQNEKWIEFLPILSQKNENLKDKKNINLLLGCQRLSMKKCESNISLFKQKWKKKNPPFFCEKISRQKTLKNSKFSSNLLQNLKLWIRKLDDYC